MKIQIGKESNYTVQTTDDIYTTLMIQTKKYPVFK